MKLFSEANQVSKVAELSPVPFWKQTKPQMVAKDLKIGFHGFFFRAKSTNPGETVV